MRFNTELGTIGISNAIIATIAGTTAASCFGVRGLTAKTKLDGIVHLLKRETVSQGVTVTTADGSYGVKGFVTDALPENYTYFYTCGPEPMLKAVHKATVTSGEMSFEERMGCGFGACMGCTIKTKSGNRRVCKDGPVFRKEDLLWED